MAVYPAWPPHEWDAAQEVVAPVVQFEAEGNYVSSRRTSTRHREEWTLAYMTSQAGFEVIRDFFLTYQGQSFTFVTPDGNSVTAMFGMERLKRSKRAGYSSFQVVVKEV